MSTLRTSPVVAVVVGLLMTGTYAKADVNIRLSRIELASYQESQTD